MQKDRVVRQISSVELDPEKNNNPIKVNNIVSTNINLADGEVVTIEGGYLDIGIIDTMKDLIVNLIGAGVFCIFGYFYIENRDKESFVRKLIPRRIR